MNGTRPVVHAKINGADAAFIADSGAFFSTISSSAAQQYHLHLEFSPVTLQGIGGMAETWLTRVDAFNFLGANFPHVQFLVTPNDMGSGAVGVLGQNVFRMGGDVEYDLANGVIRLVRPQDCKHADFAYWAPAENKVVSVMDIEFSSRTRPHTYGEAYVNGAK
ncbi:MAG TPA: retropepsin-like aspartic protease, partial [Steroidobacteraceae bacterium]|nr:retropepsin-like aspartic protease [Steroidobacteraceae bacterium]